MQQHRQEAHISKFLVVLDTGSTNGRHKVSAKKSEPRVFVLASQALHEAAGMQVAGGLARNEVILHV